MGIIRYYILFVETIRCSSALRFWGLLFPLPEFYSKIFCFSLMFFLYSAIIIFITLKVCVVKIWNSMEHKENEEERTGKITFRIHLIGNTLQGNPTFITGLDIKVKNNVNLNCIFVSIPLFSLAINAWIWSSLT